MLSLGVKPKLKALGGYFCLGQAAIFIQNSSVNGVFVHHQSCDFQQMDFIVVNLCHKITMTSFTDDPQYHTSVLCTRSNADGRKQGRWKKIREKTFY
jgi:hypothetical protein